MITNGLAILIGAVILAVYLIYAIIRKRPVKRSGCPVFLKNF